MLIGAFIVPLENKSTGLESLLQIFLSKTFKDFCVSCIASCSANIKIFEDQTLRFNPWKNLMHITATAATVMLLCYTTLIVHVPIDAQQLFQLEYSRKESVLKNKHRGFGGMCSWMLRLCLFKFSVRIRLLARKTPCITFTSDLTDKASSVENVTSFGSQSIGPHDTVHHI